MRSSRSVITRTRYSRKCSGSTPERLREPLDDLVRGHRPVAVDEVVQVAGREVALRAEAAEGHARLVHQALERRAERLLAELAPAGHQARPPPARRSARAARRRSSGRRRRRPRASSCRRRRGSASRSGRRRRTSRPRAGRGRPAGRRGRPRRASSAVRSACSSRPGQHDDVHVVRRDRGGPAHALLLVVLLLHHRRQDARRPDAVAAADERLLLAVLVEERRAERLRVARPELEDVPDLDRGLEPQRAAALRARIALARLAQVGEAAPRSRARARRRAGGSRCGSPRRRTGPRAAPRRRRPRRRSRPGRASRGRRRTPRGSRPRSPAGSRTRAQSPASPPRAGRRRGSARARPSRRASSTGIAFDVAAASTPRNSASAFDRGHAGRLDLLGSVEPLRELGRTRDAAGDLEVGRVVAALAGDERVLARARRREVVDRLLAAHHPRLGLHRVAPPARSARRCGRRRPRACGS